MSVESFAIATETATRRRLGVTLAMSLLVVLLALISLGIGAVRLSPIAVTQALFGGGSDVAQVIVREIRLPRTLLALAIGAILGLSGAALQGLLRNPLASPSLFGAPQSAAFGAVLVIALGLADVRSYALPVAAIVAAFGSVFVLLSIAGRNAGLLILILSGLAISSFAGAATALVMNLSSNPFVVLEIAFWLLGSLEDRSFQHVMLAFPFIRFLQGLDRAPEQSKRKSPPDLFRRALIVLLSARGRSVRIIENGNCKPKLEPVARGDICHPIPSRPVRVMATAIVRVHWDSRNRRHGVARHDGVNNSRPMMLSVPVIVTISLGERRRTE